MTSLGIRGLAGQSMSARRRPLTPAVVNFPILATTSWTVPRNGIYRFVIWAGGADGISNNSTGGAGQLYIAERPLTKGQVVSVVSGAVASLSSVTLPTGEVITAQPASGLTGGASTTKNQPSDIVINGTNGVNSGVDGPSGPRYLDYIGGIGGTGGIGHNAYIPAGGGGGGSTGGAPGMVLAHQVRLHQ